MTVHLGMRGGGRKIGRRELGVNRIECKREVERRGSVGEVIKKKKQDNYLDFPETHTLLPCPVIPLHSRRKRGKRGEMREGGENM